MAEHGSSEHEHEGLAHTTSIGVLVGTWASLMVLTVATVWFGGLDLSSRASFAIAMVIATVKAGLVMAFFMHLWWDKRLNLLVFLGSFLFVMLFIGMALTDKNEYLPSIEAKAEASQQQQ